MKRVKCIACWNAKIWNAKTVECQNCGMPKLRNAKTAECQISGMPKVRMPKLGMPKIVILLLSIFVIIITIFMAITLSIQYQTIILFQFMRIIEYWNDFSLKKLNYKVQAIDDYQTMIANIVEIEIMINLIQFNLYSIKMIKWLFDFYFKFKKMTINETINIGIKIENWKHFLLYIVILHN